ncbi:hypothetical protein IE4803_PD00150 (plasmid) [Rhizobium etli bv. phaseoli str. IE4803]|nr:hypothetical protein IE4803_PD00150 [Rhizobium etli bv. phaseoli str. IE4803]ARQ62171.1 hypothetical protein Kim5_PD00163 [Rhizobium sp. Kim5]
MHRRSLAGPPALKRRVRPVGTSPRSRKVVLGAIVINGRIQQEADVEHLVAQ